jgi:GNAT superfamily N-acetyltransferase
VPAFAFGPDYSEDAVLSDGTAVRLRLIRPDDKERIREGFARLSPTSRYRRFFSAKQTLTDAELRYLTEIDGINHVAIGAARLVDGAEADGLGVARFIRLADAPATAEAAIAVLDEVQGRGLGTLLFMRLAAAAAERGITRIRCDVLGDNAKAVEMLRQIETEQTVGTANGIVRIEFAIPAVATKEPVAAAPRESPLFRFFRLVAQGAIDWGDAIARLALRRRGADEGDAGGGGGGGDPD